MCTAKNRLEKHNMNMNEKTCSCESVQKNIPNMTTYQQKT